MSVNEKAILYFVFFLLIMTVVFKIDIPERFGLCNFMVFNATFYNISVISWQSVLLVEKSGVLGENHRPVSSHWQTLSLTVVSSTSRHEQGFNSLVIGNDCTGNCKFNYHTITTALYQKGELPVIKINIVPFCIIKHLLIA